ncbi:MAG: hypothetical protein ACT4O2_12875, partial [Beijerinckiaceae bacterium]
MPSPNRSGTLGHLEKVCFLVPRESDARFAGGKSGVFAMGQLGFVDVRRRYEGLDKNNDPLVAIAALVPFETFREKLKTAPIAGGLRS